MKTTLSTEQMELIGKAAQMLDMVAEKNLSKRRVKTARIILYLEGAIVAFRRRKTVNFKQAMEIVAQILPK